MVTKGPWPRAIRAGDSVIRSATTPGVCVLVLLGGPARARTTHSCHHSMDVIIVLSMGLIVDDTASVMVWPEPLAHRWSVWSRR